MVRSLRQRIGDKVSLSVLRVWWKARDLTIEPLKTEVLRRFVESRGFYLGLTNSLLGGVRRGPLVVSIEKPPERWVPEGDSQWVMALEPGEQYDIFDFMPDEPHRYDYAMGVSSKTPLCTPLLLALEQAVVAMDKLRRMPQPPKKKETQHSAATAAN